LVFHRASLGIASLEILARDICGAAAVGLSKLGITAHYRPRNDIEVDGRKISGTGGFFDGDTLFYQGTVLVDMNPADMVAALRVPAAKLGKHGIESAAARVVSLKELLGENVPDLETIKAALLDGFKEQLDLASFPGVIEAQEESTARRIFEEEVGSENFVTEIDNPADHADVYVGTYTGAGGTITSYLRLEGARQNRIREVLLTGDFFVTPPRITLDLEASLRGVAVIELEQQVTAFFDKADVGMLSVAPTDFLTSINATLEQANST
jgi:lipoate-protein ligase A